MRATLMILAFGASAQLVGAQGPTPRPRIFHLDSYHQGYGLSDETDAGIRATLNGKPIDLTTFYLDAKRHASEDEIRQSAAKARIAIDRFKPNVLIASDDPAVKYVVLPYYKDGPTPVVFCGVNWSAEPYGLPNANVTGMVEVVPVLEAIDLARKSFPSIRKLGVLSEDSLSEHNNKTQLDPKYRALGLEVTYVMVKDYAAWKREFVRLQDMVDSLYVPTQGAVLGWDEADARAFVLKQTRKPAVTTDAFMVPYALFGLTKTAVEQGEWAATAALQVLAGRRPADIPVVRNRGRKAYLNSALAARLKFVPPPELEGAKTVN
jgi:ABC-type uncharacterized transport system substrate-binding protein